MSEEINYNKELAAQIANGDEGAFTTMFHRYRNRIFTVAFKLTNSKELAEEIVQDVFLKIWLRRETLNEVENFSSFLFIVARNEAYSYMRSLAREQLKGKNLATFLPEGFYNSDSELLEKEYKSALNEAVDRLPEKQKEVYRLSKEEGLKREEIAARLQISPETVKAHLGQAMKSIRAFYVIRFPFLAIIFFS